MPRATCSADAIATGWPTPAQELLLKAALLDRAAALPAWEAWKRVADLDAPDLGTLRMLPLAYRNLRSWVGDDPVLALCRGMYRRTWYENHVLLHEVAPVVRALEAARVSTMLLKGAALVLRWYGDYGARPMGDVDVAVPKEQAAAAIAVLEDLGWALDRRRRLPTRRYLTSFVHAAPFRNPRGTAIDLHWNVFGGCLQRGVDDAFWEAAVPAAIEGVPTRILCATDQLTHLFVHGAAWDPVPPFRWCADAATVMAGAGGDVDWERVLAEARKRRRTLALREALERFRALGVAPVPAAVLEELRRARTGDAEAEAYRRMVLPWGTRDGDGSRRFASVVDLRRRYRGILARQYYDDELARLRPWTMLAGFCRFVLDDLGGERLWELPIRVAWKVIRKPSVLRP